MSAKPPIDIEMERRRLRAIEMCSKLARELARVANDFETPTARQYLAWLIAQFDSVDQALANRAIRNGADRGKEEGAARG